MTFNPSKSHFMLLSNICKRPTLQLHYLNNTIISEVQSHCNLGLHINNKLTWDMHVSHIISKASKRLNVISRYKTKLPRLALETLYLTMVRPVIEYGNVVYDSMSLSLGQSLEKLEELLLYILVPIDTQRLKHSCRRLAGPVYLPGVSNKNTFFYIKLHPVYIRHI